MTKYTGLKGASEASGISEYALRTLCREKKIRFNLAGRTKYILRLDWLEVDLERMALENINPVAIVVTKGKLRKVEE